MGFGNPKKSGSGEPRSQRKTKINQYVDSFSGSPRLGQTRL